MAEVTYTTCDRCEPNRSPVMLAKMSRSEGWALGSEEHCIVELGWQRREEGVVCPTCLEAEEEANG